jgi:GDP-D-mannose dehydratase
MFKDHINYTITDDDDNFKHLHPYSIGKILSHTTVNFYRTNYGLPFSNGILFTTESPLRKPTFLLNKVANHIKNWETDKTPLRLGNLDSYRNVNHADDIASAINLVISQNHGDNYVICGSETEKVMYLVLRMYALAGIELTHKENKFYSGNFLVFSSENWSNEQTPTNITGNPQKITALGWKPLKNIESILQEIINLKK